MTSREWIKQPLARSIKRIGGDAPSIYQVRRQLAEIELNDLLQNPSDELQRYQVSFPHSSKTVPHRAARKATFIRLLMLIIFFIFPILSIALSLSNGETPPGGWGLTIGMLVFSSLAVGQTSSLSLEQQLRPLR